MGIQKQTSWIFDSAASNHKTSNPYFFYTCTPCHETSIVKITDETVFAIVGKDIAHLSDSLIMHSVVYVSNLTCNLVLVNKLTYDLDFTARFSATSYQL